MLLSRVLKSGCSSSRFPSPCRRIFSQTPFITTSISRISIFPPQSLPVQSPLHISSQFSIFPKSSLLGDPIFTDAPNVLGFPLKSPSQLTTEKFPVFFPCQIRAGGGPRTFPGGLNKWQWKRLQDKKLREREKARLLREKELFEERRRALQRVLHGPERPWEMGRGKSKRLPSPLLSPVPENVIDRFKREDRAEDLWNEEDGPERHILPDTGLPSARFFPPRAIHSTESYEKQDNRPPWLSSEPNSEPDFESGLDNYFSEDENHKPQVKKSKPMIKQRASKESQQLSDGFKSTDLIRRSIKGIRSSPMQQNGVANPFNSLDGSRKMSTYAGAMEPEQLSAGVKRKHSEKTGSGSGADPSFMSQLRFDSFPLSSLSLRALHEDMGYEVCTLVQAESMPAILSGKDVLAKAKTGTGKTIAFLLPALEKMLKAEAEIGKVNGRRPLDGGQISILVICPTRELAAQVAEEGKQLLKHHEGCGSQIVIGGTRMPAEVARMKSYPCQLLVGTPGRLLDHIQSTPGMRQRLQNLQVLVLDECDHLLDMGFRKSLEGILQVLPVKKQTLLFSATLPQEVKAMSSIALKKDHVFVDTVGEESTQTNIQVKQESMIVPMEKQFHFIYHVLLKHMEEEPNFKVLIFSTTARGTQLSHELLTRLKIPSLEIHSRLSQSKRTKISDRFRQSKGGIVMCTSDVSARGVDYPNVTYVIQMGVPSDRAQYIHRLGRTGRAGKAGKGLLLLCEWEDFFLKHLKGLPVEKAEHPTLNPNACRKVDDAMRMVQTSIKDKAYQAWLGYYNSTKGVGFSKPQLVNKANSFALKVLLLDEIPSLLRKTVGMMGLKGVPGLRVE